MQKELKLIKVDKKIIVLFEDGSYCERDNVSKEELEAIVSAESEEEVYSIMVPEYKKKIRDYQSIVNLLDSIKNSQLLTLKGESVYWEEVSQLSMPTELVKAVFDAESKHDEVKIDTYRNFWTLMSLNPDERCRKNLFWFLNKNGLVISRCGFFVAYRNADYKGEVNGEPIYTDHHSHSFDIKIGKVVTMPRKECDDVQEHTCSRGLHLGARSWLKKNYFGNHGLVCLCNPADVVAVP